MTIGKQKAIINDALIIRNWHDILSIPYWLRFYYENLQWKKELV